VGHWVDITGGGVPPEYAPLEADFVALQAMFTAFETAKSEHFAAMNAAQEAQNDVLTTREACHEQERKIFNWYGARYSDPKDEWWTGTWWGTSGGGGEEGVTKWDAKPIAVIEKAPAPAIGLTAGCEPYDGTDRFDLRIAYAKKNESTPDMPLVDYATDVEQPVLLGLGFPLEKGYVYYVWIRARLGEEVSEWSEVVGVEWTE